MIWGKENAARILGTLKEVYDQHIIIRTQFDALKDGTEKALSEARRLNERLIEKIEGMEKERIKAESDFQSKLAKLEARLDAFSEKAMRSAVTEMAEKYFRENFSKDVSRHEKMLTISDKSSDDDQ